MTQPEQPASLTRVTDDALTEAAKRMPFVADSRNVDVEPVAGTDRPRVTSPFDLPPGA